MMKLFGWGYHGELLTTLGKCALPDMGSEKKGWNIFLTHTGLENYTW